MLRIAICDDIPEYLTQIKSIIEQWKPKPDTFAAEVFEDGDSLIAAHTCRPFDIILLDVIMPLLNGMKTAREIRQLDKSVKIVFLTSSPEFAVESYTVKANNYLLKPINPNALLCCLDELYADIISQARSITVRSTAAVHRVELLDIEYIEAQNKHILFFLSNGSMIDSIDPMYSFEDKLLLSDGFFKCHRSYIVNIYQIDTYTAKEIKMRSGCRIPISRNCHREFETAYFSLIFGKAGDE